MFWCFEVRLIAEMVLALLLSAFRDGAMCATQTPPLRKELFFRDFFAYFCWCLAGQWKCCNIHNLPICSCTEPDRAFYVSLQVSSGWATKTGPVSQWEIRVKCPFPRAQRRFARSGMEYSRTIRSQPAKLHYVSRIANCLTEVVT